VAVAAPAHLDEWARTSALVGATQLGGFSTGQWVGNVLHIHTDQLSAAWTRRNGLPTDDRASMDEVWFRYGNVLTHIMMISDSSTWPSRW